MNVEPTATPNQGALARARDARRRTVEGGQSSSANPSIDETQVPQPDVPAPEAPPADPWTDVTPSDPADAPPPYAATPVGAEAVPAEALDDSSVAVDIDDANAPDAAADPASAGKGKKFGRNFFTVTKKEGGAKKEKKEKKEKEEPAKKEKKGKKEKKEPVTRTADVQLESGPPPAASGEAGAAMLTAGSWQLLVAYLFAASIVLMFASIKYVDDFGDLVESKFKDLANYGLSAAVISLVLCLALLVLSKKKPALLEKQVKVPKLGELSLLQLLALLLLLWWLLAATILTFEGPFVVTSNGYLSAWAALVLAAMLAAQLLEPVAAKLRSATSLSGRPKLLFWLTLCGGCVMLASIEHASGSSEGAWGVSVGVLTLVIAGAALLAPPVAAKMDADPKIGKALSALLLALWIPGAGVLTFEGPFLATGNGFFGAWGGLFCALLLVLLEFGLTPPALPLPQ